MRPLSLLPLAALAACAAAPAQSPTVGVIPGYKCDAAAGQSYVGQTATADNAAALMAATHSASLRWAPPGVMLSMIFIESRVTVRLDHANKILAVNCG
ncbi:I78 family peptidase inhibitor [Sphingomonas sp. ASV193]|uniref:I78 family peptidase inhibitor n=1 Tax=Sphingomonas sp. ASV193 TaxID=3144405 RepID=UPI0032E90BE5